MQIELNMSRYYLSKTYFKKPNNEPFNDGIFNVLLKSLCKVLWINRLGALSYLFLLSICFWFNYDFF